MISILGNTFLIGLLVILAYFYIGGKTRAIVEADSKPIYERQCSIVIKNFYLAGPLARLSIYKDYLVLAYGHTKHIIQLGKITNIRLKGWLFKGIEIEYAQNDKKNRITIGPLNPKDAYTTLERAISKET